MKARAAIGSEGPDWRQIATEAPAARVFFVHGRRRLQDPFAEAGGPKSEREGNLSGLCDEQVSGRSSPKRDWAQKAVVATARQAASKGEARDRPAARDSSKATVTGRRAGRRELRGHRFSTPLST
jgi:hypothetical protein